MSRNFDFPPASTGEGEGSNHPPNGPPRFPTATPIVPGPVDTALTVIESESSQPPGRLQYLRELIQREIAARDTGNWPVPPAPPPPPPPQVAVPNPSSAPAERRRRRAIIRNIASLRARQATPPTPASHAGPSSTPAATLRPAQARPQVQRPRPPREARASSSLANLHRASARLAEASSDLRSLLDNPVRFTAPVLHLRDHSHDAEAQRRFKRRKLDHGEAGMGGIAKVSYGYYGQVEPGQLKLEIVSCDGGNYPDAEGKDQVYSAENVLRNDRSVYCTKISQCNLLLQHQGGTAFCLSKLMLKAPQAGFTAPVQEGMVFVSMTSENILDRTAPYRMLYRPSAQTGRRQPRQRASPFPPSIDNEHAWSNEQPQRRPFPPASLSRPEQDINLPRDVGGFGLNSSAEDAEPDVSDQSDEDADDSWIQEAGITGTITVPTATPYTIATDGSEEEEDEDEGDDATPEVRAATARRRREAIARAMSENEDEMEDDDIHVFADDLVSLGHFPVIKSRTRLTQPNHIAWAPSEDRINPSSQDGQGAGPEVDLLPPHARFFIKKDKSKCCISFDPPVSGRYLLLKLWSPAADENIDIQSIVAHGFAGPRYFPAREMR